MKKVNDREEKVLKRLRIDEKEIPLTYQRGKKSTEKDRKFER